MRAAIYTRISQDRQGLEAGVQRQEADCRELIAREGWELVGVYSDNDISASRYARKQRIAYHEMLDAVAAGEIQVVVAWHPKRLVRQTVELEELINLAERTRVRFEFVTLDMPLDLNTATGRAMARIAVAFGAMESEESSERIRRARRQEAAEGKRRTGGRRRFGFEPDGYTIRPEEADAIRDAAAQILAGSSVYRIASAWNDRGLLTPSGKPWTTSKVAALLQQESLAGLRVYGPTGEQFDAQWPAILTPDEHTLLVRRLQPTGGKAGKRRGLLSGIVRCSECGRPLMYSRHDNDRYRYVCDRGRGGGCGRVRVAQGRELESAVLALTAARSAHMPRPRRSSDRDRDRALQRLRALDDRDAELVEMLSAGELTRAEFNRARARIVSERDGLERNLRATGDRERAKDLARLFIEWRTGQRELNPGELDELREIVQSSLPGGVVYVKPGERFGRRFDPERLEVREQAD